MGAVPKNWRVCIVAMTSSPDLAWMKQMARNLTLPPRRPNLNAHCERWIRSVKSELIPIVPGHCKPRKLIRIPTSLT